MNDATVACRQMGFNGVLLHLMYFTTHHSILPSDCLGGFLCHGNESRLLDCPHQKYTSEECHSIGVSCGTYIFICSTYNIIEYC